MVFSWEVDGTRLLGCARIRGRGLGLNGLILLIEVSKLVFLRFIAVLWAA